MKKEILLLLITFVFSLASFAGTTPQTITMDASTNNATAFGADGTLGTDGSATFYVHWDATYIYFGWSGGRTTYSSDMYYVGIDLNDGSGSNGPIEGVSFDASVPDFYVVYENNFNYYGIPASNGNAYEVYQNDGSNAWSFVSRTIGDDGGSSQIDFQDAGGEVRLRIAWSTLGVSPGTSQPLGLTFWNNNSDGNFAWASFPTNNPTGGTTQTMTHKLKFADTADGTNPSSDGTTETLSTLLPVELSYFQASENTNQINLLWQTERETNNSHFNIQRSINAYDFETIGRVNGVGDATYKVEYQFIDQTPIRGKNYYRLEQVDFDGKTSLSHLVLANFQSSISVQYFPNPIQDKLNIQWNAEVDNGILEAVDTKGRVLYSTQINEDLYINTENWSRGVYFLRIRNNSGLLWMEKVVK